MSIKALILVDIQNDFLPGGALAVSQGNEILAAINSLLAFPFNVVIATKDWHPKDHSSFAVNHKKTPGDKIMIDDIEQILWPVHCLQESPGAEFPPQLDTKQITRIFYKGTDKTIDSYSAFFDNGHRKATGLADFLKEHKIDELYVAGLATDYCVKYSVLDALHLGYKVFVLTDACKGVNLQTNDSKEALNQMKEEGAGLITSELLAKTFKDAS